jgi:FKBP-type peptidyl-prolyl cis-trans isomerase FkpA
MKKYLVSLMLLVTIAGCKKVQTDFTETDRQIIQNYITSHNLTNVKSTPEGLYYIIEKPGSTAHPNIYSTVIMAYTGKLANDTIFDTTEGESPATFGLTSVITGWQIGVPFFGRGGKGKLLIPSSLGYGSVAQYGIPKNSVLIFDINLLDFY